MGFAIISEGVTDQIIIEAAVRGYLGKDIELEPLQPKNGSYGGWEMVFKYCKSADFRESLPYNEEIIIIHIDCDILKGADIPKEYQMALTGKSVAETFELVKGKLIESISEPIFNLCKDKLVFAIAIDEVECWLLPVYFPKNAKVCKKLSGAIRTLNPALTEVHKFYIDAKNPDHYRTMAKALTKKKTVQRCYDMNESFSLFIDSLDTAVGPSSLADL